MALRSIPHVAMDTRPGFESWLCDCPRPLNYFCGTSIPTRDQSGVGEIRARTDGGRHLGEIQLTQVTITPTHLMESWHDGCGTLDSGSPGRLPRPTPKGKAGLPGNRLGKSLGVSEEAEATPWLTLVNPLEACPTESV